MFHVEHKYLKINNIPDKKEEKSVRAPAPPPRMYVKIVHPVERSKARPPYILFSGARGEWVRRDQFHKRLKNSFVKCIKSVIFVRLKTPTCNAFSVRRAFLQYLPIAFQL